MLAVVLFSAVFYSIECITSGGSALVGKRDAMDLLKSSDMLMDDKTYSYLVKKRVKLLFKDSSYPQEN